MRIKSKKPLGQEDEEAAGFLEEPFAGPPPALPYKLVPPTVQPQPAVVVAASARIRQKAPLQPGNLDLPRLPWPLPHNSMQLSVPAAVPALPLPAPVPPVPRAAPPSRLAAPAAAPARASAVVPKHTAAGPAAKPPAAAAAKAVSTTTLGEAPAAAATKAGARQTSAAGNVAAAVSVAATASIAPAAATPAAAAGAAQAAGRPTRKRKQTSMGDDMIPPDALFKPYTKAKRATAAVATRLQQPKGEQAKEAKPPPPPPPPPYRLVTPALQPRPAVAVAVPIDIAHLARQLEQEERRRAAAAADALVLVQVMAPPQLPGPMLTRSSKAAAAAGGKNSKQQEKGKQQERQGEKAGAGMALRQRPPRPSRRNTPEPSAQQGAAAGSSKTAGGNVAWHPGMELHGGISYVDTVQSASAKPPPAVVVGTPPRWQQEPVRIIDMVEFSDDPMLASIEFLKHTARTAGRQPNYSGPLQQAVNAEQRLYKERLQRAVYARDGRRFQGPIPDQATRRSTRNRQAPQVFLPTTSQQQTARRLKVVVTADPDEQTATRMGADYQAVLPTLRSRSPAPSEDEARWLEELVMEPHMPDVAPEPLSKLAEMAAAGSPERAAWVESSQQQLAAAVGSLAAISLGLETMGPACIRASWTEEEEEAFAAGIKAYSRDFRAVQEEYVPSRTVQDLADYYYNVWKLRATQRAVQWYQEKAQANLEYQAELARQEQAREAELARKAERQAAAGSRRQLREVLQWMKNAARCPANALAVNRPVVRDRAARAAKLIGSLNAQQSSN